MKILIAGRKELPLLQTRSDGFICCNNSAINLY